jgi:hypothetical protein
MQYKQAASSLFWQILSLILHDVSPDIFGELIDRIKKRDVAYKRSQPLKALDFKI